MKIHLIMASLCMAALLAGCSGKAFAPVKQHKDLTPTMRLTLIPESPPAVGQTANVLLKINHIEERKLLAGEDLQKLREFPMHLMIIDQSFTDYQHIHPTPTKTRGLFSFPFTPKMASRYHVWADIVPLATGKQEFVMADLETGRATLSDRTPKDQADVGGYHFALGWDQPPEQYDSSTGTVTVTDRSGNAVSPESVVFAHVDGFHEDFRTVLHANALAESGKGKMQFEIEPQKAGFLKLYALVIINGKPLVAPFAVQVAK